MLDLVIANGKTINELRDKIASSAAVPTNIDNIINNFQHCWVYLFNLTFDQATLITKEMSAEGIEVLIFSEKISGVELLSAGTISQYLRIIEKLKKQLFDLSRTAEKLEKALFNYQLTSFPPLTIKDCSYDFHQKTYIMGIINLTPDSFSQDGLYTKTNYIDAALGQAQQMIASGADFLDIGAESSRPGAIKVSEQEEEERLLPLLKELVNSVTVPISVDTYKPKVAAKAINIGASIINDIWGLKAPGDIKHDMAKLAAEAKIPVIIMHNKVTAGYQHLMKEILDSLAESIEIACTAGVDFKQIVVDPGIGFAKTYQDNLYILQNLDQLKILGRPILLGTSRKSVIGTTLGLPVNERLEGTIATSIWGLAKGANILRVHDVEAHSRAVKMGDAIKNR